MKNARCNSHTDPLFKKPKLLKLNDITEHELCMKIINNSLEHSYETEKGSLLWWELNPMPFICQMSALDC